MTDWIYTENVLKNYMTTENPPADLLKHHLELVTKLARVTAELGLQGDKPVNELAMDARALRRDLGEARAEIERLQAALEPFARKRLSTEPIISDCLYRTPEMGLREAAEAIAREDREILAARAALAGGKEAIK